MPGGGEAAEKWVETKCSAEPLPSSHLLMTSQRITRSFGLGSQQRLAPALMAGSPGHSCNASRQLMEAGSQVPLAPLPASSTRSRSRRISQQAAVFGHHPAMPTLLAPTRQTKQKSMRPAYRNTAIIPRKPATSLSSFRRLRQKQSFIPSLMVSSQKQSRTG